MLHDAPQDENFSALNLLATIASCKYAHEQLIKDIHEELLEPTSSATKRVKCWCCSNSKADGYDYDTNTCGDVDVDEEFRLICITGEAEFECVYCFMDDTWGSVGEFGNRSDYDCDHCVQRETPDPSFSDPRDYDYLPTYLHREHRVETQPEG